MESGGDMDWSDERYVRLYTRDTTNWLLLSWKAQGLFALILRKCNRIGVIDLGKAGLKGVSAHIGGPAAWPELEPLIDELLLDGCIVHREHEGREYLVLPNYLEAQECPSSAAQRKRDSRERKRAMILLSVTKRDQSVTKRDSGSQYVTKCHAGSSTRDKRSLRTVPCLTDHSCPSDEHSNDGPIEQSLDHCSEEQHGSERVSKSSDLVAEIWSAWLERWREHRGTGKPPVLSKERKRQIQARLKDGYSIDDLKLAIDGIWSDSFCLTGGHTRPEVVFRNSGQVELYMAKASPSIDPDNDRPELQLFTGEA